MILKGTDVVPYVVLIGYNTVQVFATDAIQAISLGQEWHNTEYLAYCQSRNDLSGYQVNSSVREVIMMDAAETGIHIDAVYMTHDQHYKPFKSAEQRSREQSVREALEQMYQRQVAEDEKILAANEREKSRPQRKYTRRAAKKKSKK